MIVERNKQIKVESHSNLQEKTAADDRADYNNYSTCQSLSYMDISTLHLKYPSKYGTLWYSTVYVDYRIPGIKAKNYRLPALSSALTYG
jgi:hypothetical protein